MSIEKTTLRIIDRKLSSNTEQAYWKAASDLSNYIESDKDIKIIWPMVVKYSSRPIENLIKTEEKSDEKAEEKKEEKKPAEEKKEEQ